MTIQIIAYNPSTHAVVPREITQQQWDVPGIGSGKYAAMGDEKP